MKPIPTRSWSTPLIIATSATVALSGVLMFFHLAEDLVKSMHEWLGLLFVAAIMLHVLNHWLPFSRYFGDNQARVVLATVMLIAGGWMTVAGLGGEGEGGHPAKRFMGGVPKAPLVAVAAIQGQTGQQALERLRAAGVQVDSDQQSLAELATANDREVLELLDVLLK